MIAVGYEQLFELLTQHLRGMATAAGDTDGQEEWHGGVREAGAGGGLG